MIYLVTTIREGSIRIYKEWLGHDMTVINE